MPNLKSMLICDNGGIPFYSRDFDNFEKIDDALLSGLLSAIGTIGKSLFKQDIATISFGENIASRTSRIVTISKELFSLQKQIFFVFFIQGDVELKELRSLSTRIFMEAKDSFKNAIPEQKLVAEKINKIINVNYNGLKDL